MRLLVILLAVATLAIGCGKQKVTSPKQTPALKSGVLQGKNILMIVGHDGFQDEELAVPKDVFTKAGAKVTIASSDMSPATGMEGASVKPDILVSRVAAADYDAIVFVGGYGSREYWDDSAAQGLAKRAFQDNMVVGASSYAPVILANADLIGVYQVTAWPDAVTPLHDDAAKFVPNEAVVTDWPFVTANGPDASEEFGKAVVRAMLAGKPKKK